MSDGFTKESSIDGNVGAMPMTLPREAILDTVPRSSLAATKKIINVVPITSNTIGPSQTLQFLLPQRNFAKANSIYLKFRFTATGGSSTQVPWSFSGGMQSCASLFNNISIQAGGSMLESCQNYHIWHNNVMEWMHQGKDMLAIESMCSGARIPENFDQGLIAYFSGTIASGTSITSVVVNNAGAAGTGTRTGALRVGMWILGVGTDNTVPSQITAIAANGDLTVAPAMNVTSGTDKGFLAFLPSVPSTQAGVGYDWNSESVSTNLNGFASAGQQVGASATPVATGASLIGGSPGQYQFANSASGSNSYNIVFTMPIYLGFFNPKESQLIPLEFINGGVLLTLQTNPVTKAFWTPSVPTASTGFTTYTLQDFELCYTEIQPDPSYMAQVRNDLMQQNAPKLIKIEAQSYQNYLLACASGNTRQMFNANISSLSAILWGRIVGLDDWTTSKMFQWVGSDGNNTTRYEIYFDNVLMYQSPRQLTDIGVVVRQLQEALGSSVTDYAISPYVAGRGLAPKYSSATIDQDKLNFNTYAGGHALMGLSTRVFSSSSTSMDGTPVGTITINFYNDDGDSTSNLWYFYLVYDYVYLVDGTGSVSKAQ